METITVRIRQDAERFTPQEEEALQWAGRVIKNGGLAAFPTETVYGLGGDALDRESSRKIPQQLSSRFRRALASPSSRMER